MRIWNQPSFFSLFSRFKVNFGQTAAWFPPPPGFVYIDHVHANERVRGSKSPNTKSECEVSVYFISFCWIVSTILA